MDKTSAIFAEQVKRLKIELNRAISERIEAFHSETGITPSAVDVDLVNVQTIDQRMPHHLVGNVRLTFDI